MKIRMITAGTVIFSLLAVGNSAMASLNDQLDAIVSSYVASYQIQNGKVPGALVGVWGPDEDPMIFEKGFANLATNDPTSAADAYRVGSITKSFTVTRLLQLAADSSYGLSLDDPISKYISTATTPGLTQNLSNGNATLRQLANMTSGIFNYTEDPTFTTSLIEHPLQVRTDVEIVNAANNNHTPYFTPGEDWYYSNTNTVLLGMVVEKVTGNPLGQEIMMNIVEPLGMSASTIYPTTPAMPNPYAHGYAIIDADVGQVDFTDITPTMLSGAGAMISTLDDLRIWGEALGTGALITEEMFTERLEMVLSNEHGPFYDAYGLGMGTIDGWLGHTAETFGFESLVMYNPLTGQTVVILVNGSPGNHVPTEMFLQIKDALAVPEPSTIALIAFVSMGLVLHLWRRRAAR